jgi:oxygen-dependent protoporphyrinogen oxidase
VRGRVVVIGGGVAGLAAADRLLRSGGASEVTVLEAGPRVGGKIASVEVGGLRVEAGPDSLLARKPWAVDLVRDLGLAAELVPAAPAGALIWSERGLVPFPSGPFGIPADPVQIWRWPGLSTGGKARAMRDLLAHARRDDADEALGSLLRRRLGDEVTDRLVAPLLGGLFAGDVDRLSLRATFPELAAWERESGSLIHGAHAVAAASRSASPAPMFVRLRGGLERLPAALADRIGAARIRTSTPATAVHRIAVGYVVSTPDGDLDADAVVVATPASAAAALLADVASEAGAELAAIPYVSTAAVVLVYDEGSNDRLPDASGFVVPRARLAMTACTLISKKWPDPAFGSRAVVRCFVGAAGIEDVVDEPDVDIVEGVGRQLAALLPLPGRPEASAVVRWPRSMPQYEVGHLDRVDRIERALPEGVVVAGAAYRGVGIADAVRSGRQAADRVASMPTGSRTNDRGERVR